MHAVLEGMKILTVDTSTSTCTVGIANADGVLAEFVDSNGQTHARHLMGMIQNSVVASGVRIEEIDGFAVVTGPTDHKRVTVTVSFGENDISVVTVVSNY